jgi:hypothetical protein
MAEFQCRRRLINGLLHGGLWRVAMQMVMEAQRKKAGFSADLFPIRRP